MTTIPITDELSDTKEILPGSQLAIIRQEKGLTKEYVAGKLHLRVQVVDFLEKDDYLKLPEPVFIKGYLRGYAKLLNVSPEPYLQAFNAQFSSEKKPEKALWQSAKESHRSELLLRWATGLIVVIAIAAGAVWWQKEKTAQLFPIVSKKEAPSTLVSKEPKVLNNTAAIQSLFSTPSSDEETNG